MNMEFDHFTGVRYYLGIAIEMNDFPQTFQTRLSLSGCVNNAFGAITISWNFINTSFCVIIQNFFWNQIFKSSIVFPVRMSDGTNDSLNVSIEGQCARIQKIFAFQYFHLLGRGKQTAFGTV